MAETSMVAVAAPEQGVSKDSQESFPGAAGAFPVNGRPKSFISDKCELFDGAMKTCGAAGTREYRVPAARSSTPLPQEAFCRQ
jgi:hypothetical protein